MYYKIKKIISYIIVFCIVLSIFPESIYAVTEGEPYMENGYIKMFFIDQAAQTSTTFKTIGWNAHKTEDKGMNPLRNQNGTVTFVDDDMEEVRSEELPNGKVQTFFEIPADTVISRFSQGNMLELKENQSFYLSSIFNVNKGGKKYSGPWHSYKEIVNAAGWGTQTKEDLKNYYNKKVIFKSPSLRIDTGDFEIPTGSNHTGYPLVLETRVNGKKIKAELIGGGKAGDSKSVTLDNTINIDGVTANLNSTHWEYEARRGVVNDKKIAPDSGLNPRTVLIKIGGTRIVADYKVDPQVKVQHWDLEKNTLIEEQIFKVTDPDRKFTANMKPQSNGLQYIYSEISPNGGSSWKDRSQNPTRNIIANPNTIVRFYYGKDSSLIADLGLLATPDKIPKDKTATVKFTLDASKTISKDLIKSYTYFLADNEDDLETDSAQVGTSDKPTLDVNKSNVSGNTTWYGKVIVTDIKGKISTAYAEIDIEEMEEVKAELPWSTAKIEVALKKPTMGSNKIANTVDINEIIDRIEFDSQSESSSANDPYIRDTILMDVYINKPDILTDIDTGKIFKYSEEQYVTFGWDAEVSGTGSKSDNGILQYRIVEGTDNQWRPDNDSVIDEQKYIGSSSTYNFEAGDNLYERTLSKQEMENILNGSNYTYDYSVRVWDKSWTSLKAIVERGELIGDVKGTSYKNVVAKETNFTSKVRLRMRFIPNDKISLIEPEVNLSVNNTNFAIYEKALFTPEYISIIDKHYPITSKRWEIHSVDGNFKDQGNGDIPSSYTLNVNEGSYIARQYITYKDDDLNDHEKFAEVTFNVWERKEPNVGIRTDKDKYVAPTTATVTTTFEEDHRLTFPITGKGYKFRKKNSSEIIFKNTIKKSDYPDLDLGEGEVAPPNYGSLDSGIFPRDLDLGIELDAGYYTVEQIIFWEEYGVEKNKTATYDFKLISPKPVADFRVDMKMTTSDNSWDRIDLPSKSGKEYRQIKIDLTPSIVLNQELENPYPLNFSSQDTQIQILPLTDDLQADRTKNNQIHVFNAADKQLVDDTITFKAKQSIDVRFDEEGRYRIKVKVSNNHYVSNWIVRDIIIREDLPPVVDISLQDVLNEEGKNVIYRNPDNLRVQFKVNTSARVIDDDTIDMDSAKLEIRFDYNSDSDTSNDGVHSSMFYMKNMSNLQSYMNISNEGMTLFNIDVFSNTFPILGKMRFEYSVSENPTIPYFLGGSLPPVPKIQGTSYGLPIDKKIVTALNNAGNIKVNIGKESKVEITIVLGTGANVTANTNKIVNTLKTVYGENIRIYVVDTKGNRELLY